jgi:hypothetical protein
VCDACFPVVAAHLSFQIPDIGEVPLEEAAAPKS